MDDAKQLTQRQNKARDMLRESIASGKRRPILQGPTGFGKTLLATAIFEGVLEKKRKAAFVVPHINLIDQTVETLYEQGIKDVGVIQGNDIRNDWTQPIQVCSTQTLNKRNRFPEADLVIIDEVHRWFNLYGRWINERPNVPFIGMSATPWTRGLGQYFNNLLIAATTKELIADGFLCPFKVFAPSHPDLQGVSTTAGDYNQTELADRMNVHKLVGDVVGTWLLRGRGRPTFVFAVDCAHAKALQKQFLDAGVRCGYMDAHSSPFDRQKIKSEFKHGVLEVVCNVGVLTIGVDWPNFSCISLVRPTKSEMLFVQMIGRGLRIDPSKDDLLVLDHSDSTLRLGFVDEINHNELDNGVRAEKQQIEMPVPLPKECPQCHGLRARGILICPFCGYTAEPPRVVSYVNGQGKLMEVDEEYLKEGTKKRMKLGADTPMPIKALWLAMLKHIAQEKGYKKGWASQKYRTLFSVWPDWSLSTITPTTPTAECRQWVAKEAKRWARQQYARPTYSQATNTNIDT